MTLPTESVRHLAHLLAFAARVVGAMMAKGHGAEQELAQVRTLLLEASERLRNLVATRH